MALSPDGRRLAVLQQTPQGDRQRAILDIVSADDPGGARVRVPIGDVQAQRLEWADDRHVLLVVITETEVQGNRPMHSMIREQGRTITARRVLSIDADTGRGLALFGEDRQALNYNLDLGRIIDTVSDRPGHILMAARGFNLLNELYRVSLSTGRSELVERGVARTLDWKTVDGVPVLRRDLSARGDVQTWRARPIGGSEWRFVRSDRILEQPQFTWAGPSETESRRDAVPGADDAWCGRRHRAGRTLAPHARCATGRRQTGRTDRDRRCGSRRLGPGRGRPVDGPLRRLLSPPSRLTLTVIAQTP